MLPCLYIHYTRLLCYFKETRVKLPNSQSLQLIVFRNINPQGVQEKKHKSLKPPSSQILEDTFKNAIIKNMIVFFGDIFFYSIFLYYLFHLTTLPFTFIIHPSTSSILSIYLSIDLFIYLYILCIYSPISTHP